MQLLDSATYRVVCAQFWESIWRPQWCRRSPTMGTPHVCAPERGSWCDHGLRSFVIITATIGDVATAAMQLTYLLAAICRGDWVGWTRPRETEMSCPIRFRTIFRRRRQMPGLSFVVELRLARGLP